MTLRYSDIFKSEKGRLSDHFMRITVIFQVLNGLEQLGYRVISSSQYVTGGTFYSKSVPVGLKLFNSFIEPL